jgi:hypothetical protein
VEPTFAIAGGQRCGTTSLYHLLDQHPEIFLAKPVRPEPKFFLEDPRPGKDRAWYIQRWFSDTGDAKAAGEKSASYLESDGAAARMKRLFPALRVIFVLRHPVERALSNHRFSRQHGLETRPLDWAVRNEASRLRETRFPALSAHPFAYVRRGRYADCLASFLRAFSRSEIHVILFEELLDDPAGVCGRVFRFLGVDAGFRPPRLDVAYNVQEYGDLSLAQDTIDYLFEQFRGPNRRLQDLLHRDLRAWAKPTPMILRALAR